MIQMKPLLLGQRDIKKLSAILFKQISFTDLCRSLRVKIEENKLYMYFSWLFFNNFLFIAT